MKVFFRKFHRWLGLAMALQIVAWMGSGLYFSIFPIEAIRGEHLTHEPENLAGLDFSGLVPVSVAWDAVASAVGPEALPGEISLQTLHGSVYYRVSGSKGETVFTRLVDGITGKVSARLDSDAARAIAVSSLVTPGVVVSVDWVETVPPGGEVRGRGLPLWRVAFSEPELLNLYLDPWTGEIAARRTARWRLFDFLWMLHIMDFGERDDFNTPLLQAAAALGLLVALSGVVFWALTTRLFRRRRAAANGVAG